MFAKASTRRGTSTVFKLLEERPQDRFADAEAALAALPAESPSPAKRGEGRGRGALVAVAPKPLPGTPALPWSPLLRVGVANLTILGLADALIGWERAQGFPGDPRNAFFPMCAVAAAVAVAAGVYRRSGTRLWSAFACVLGTELLVWPLASERIRESQGTSCFVAGVLLPLFAAGIELLRAHPPAALRPLIARPPRPATPAAPASELVAGAPAPAPGPRVETDAQKAARLTAQVMAWIYGVGLWFAVASEFVTWEHFRPSLYAAAFTVACGFSFFEAKRASRARSPGVGWTLLACLGAGFAFVGTVAGNHAAALFERPLGSLGAEEQTHALEVTLFFTLPLQALGLGLALAGHRALAPTDENAPTREELALVDRLLGTLTLILYGLTWLVFTTSPDPLTFAPALVTLSVALTFATLKVTQARRRRASSTPRTAPGVRPGLVCAILVLPVSGCAAFIAFGADGGRSFHVDPSDQRTVVLLLALLAAVLEVGAIALAVQGLVAISRRAGLEGRGIARATLVVATVNIVIAAAAWVALAS